MSGHINFVNGGNICIGDPDDAPTAYNYLQGKDGCGNTLINYTTGQPTKYKYSGNACFRTGWYDSTSGDKRNMINCGPFNMNSGDTQTVVYLISIARGSNNNQSVCDLLNMTDNIKYFYYNCFNLIGITPVGTTVPDKYSLEQNYPNPFNPVTNIVFEMPKSGFVNLKVYDALGRELVTLVSQQMQAGKYSADWNAENYPSGVYFYRLESEDFSSTRKMILVK